MSGFLKPYLPTVNNALNALNAISQGKADANLWGRLEDLLVAAFSTPLDRYNFDALSDSITALELSDYQKVFKLKPEGKSLFSIFAEYQTNELIAELLDIFIDKQNEKEEGMFKVISAEDIVKQLPTRKLKLALSAYLNTLPAHERIALLEQQTEQGLYLMSTAVEQLDLESIEELVRNLLTDLQEDVTLADSIGNLLTLTNPNSSPVMLVLYSTEDDGIIGAYEELFAALPPKIQNELRQITREVGLENAGDKRSYSPVSHRKIRPDGVYSAFTPTPFFRKGSAPPCAKKFSIEQGALKTAAVY